ncbi:MAG: lysophospholipid acyltransferase family protein [Deltaproteobacteria bacterium]|nr:lysophospholipid acyltransferase family protein [Deltaproteobacteria bacterium]
MVFAEGALKDLYRLWAWGPWRASLGVLPAGNEVRANRQLGRLAAAALPAQRAALRATLAGALGARPELDAVVTQLFETHFANQYVGLSFQRMTLETAPRYLHLTGREHLDQALRAGRGVILAHPHLGLPQLPLHLLGLEGYPVHQVGGGAPAQALSALGTVAARTRRRLEGGLAATLHDGTGFVRPVVRALERGEVVLTACDGTGGGQELGRREVCQVLGRRMRLPVFSAWLAEHTGAAVLPLHCYRAGPLYQADVSPPLAPEDLTAQLATLLDGWLRAHPGEWHFWDQWRPGSLLDG